MGYTQGPTPIKTDKNKTERLLNGMMCKKRQKGFDVKFHWMRPRTTEEILIFLGERFIQLGGLLYQTSSNKPT